METIEKKVQEATEKVSGFGKWLEDARGSRFWAYHCQGIKRDVAALDYDAKGQYAAVILQEKGQSPKEYTHAGETQTEIYNGIGMREVKTYVAEGDRRDYDISGWQMSSIAKILEPAKRVDVRVHGLRENHGGLVFEVIGKDDKGVIKSGKYCERDDIDRNGAE